jgi:hypothetical protein
LLVQEERFVNVKVLRGAAVASAALMIAACGSSATATATRPIIRTLRVARIPRLFLYEKVAPLGAEVLDKFFVTNAESILPK